MRETKTFLSTFLISFLILIIYYIFPANIYLFKPNSWNIRKGVKYVFKVHNKDIRRTSLMSKSNRFLKCFFTKIVDMVIKFWYDEIRLINKAFIKFQFGYCSLVSMFHSLSFNNKINHMHETHEKILRITCNDNVASSSWDLFHKDNSDQDLIQYIIEML